MTLVVLVIAVIVEATFVVAMEIIMRREYSEEYKISQQLTCTCENVFFLLYHCFQCHLHQSGTRECIWGWSGEEERRGRGRRKRRGIVGVTGNCLGKEETV